MTNTQIPTRTKKSPDGGSSSALQSGTQIQPVHKWPLRPGVQVHINGSNSLTLASSGSVLSDIKSDHLISSARHYKSDLMDQQSVAGEVLLQPHYEQIRDKLPDVDQMTDSGSESTRSVIRVGPVRKALPPIKIDASQSKMNKYDDFKSKQLYQGNISQILTFNPFLHLFPFLFSFIFSLCNQLLT